MGLGWGVAVVGGYTLSGVLVAALTLGAFSRPITGDVLLIASAAVAHVVAVGVSVLVFRKRPRAFERIAAVATLGLFGSLGWGPGLLTLANGVGDRNVREEQARILDFSEHTSRGTTKYYLTFAPFPPLDEPQEIQVEASHYERVKTLGKGASVRIRVARGRLGIQHLPLDWGTPFVTFP